jgi:hypothetical protein
MPPPSYIVRRPVAAIDKNKVTIYRDASQVTTARSVSSISNFVSINGVLASIKKGMQAGRGGNYVLTSTISHSVRNIRV